MQKIPKIIWLILIVALLGGYIFFFENPVKEAENQKSAIQAPLYQFQADQVDGIVIKSPEGEAELAKTNQQQRWEVVNTENYQADENAVKDLLQKILDLKTEQIASQNPENFSKFEVDEGKGVEVILNNAQNKELAHFFIGKEGTQFKSQYIRKNEGKAVYLISQNIKSDFVKPLNAWRDHKILVLNKEKITAITVKNPTGTGGLVLARSGSGWVLGETQTKVKPEKAEALLTALADLTTTDFPEDKVELEAKNADYIITLDIGAQTKTVLFLQKMPKGEDYFAMVEGNKTLFQISDATWKAITELAGD